MATHAYTGSASAFPTSLIAQAVPMLTRHELAALTDRLLERLDQIDGEPDFEDDDPSGQCDEDGVNTNLVNARADTNTVLNGDEGDYCPDGS